MKLQIPDGRSFSLRVDRYEFPDEELGPTEDNPADEFETGRFLIISVHFANDAGSWSATGPNLTTTEMEQLANWFESIPTHNSTDTGIYFIERDMELTVDTDATTLSVHLFRDFLPPWARSGETVTIDFPVKQMDLISAAAALREQLKQFPGRPPLS
ncbi:MAG: hypothetical protein CMJ48_04345 [Planctomycetaceae bacterium]|nr:hypothetical protein [Planctomycetaceae bacterium]